MELNTIKDAFDRVSKKQKLSYSKTQDVIDLLGQEIELVLKKLLSAAESSGLDHKVVITELNSKLNEIGPVNQLGGSQKELNVALSKYGKIVDKLFYSDIARAYREVEFDGHVMNGIIALHFYRQGLFELGDCFIIEVHESDAASLKAPFFEMYQMLEQMKARNLQPALTWASTHHDQLLQKGSALEFKLHRLQFVQILQKGTRNDALMYARTSFASLHMNEIQKLMACLLWTGRLENSPYADLLSFSQWDALALELIEVCCGPLGQSYDSPLHVTMSAGCQALPSLLKLANVMANKKQEWQTMKQLPVQIELDREFQFHSIFACPVSRDHSTDDNPPMLMPCGHVLCKQSIIKLSKGSNRTFKCPYCPAEAIMMQCRQLYF